MARVKTFKCRGFHVQSECPPVLVIDLESTENVTGTEYYSCRRFGLKVSHRFCKIWSMGEMKLQHVPWQHVQQGHKALVHALSHREC